MPWLFTLLLGAIVAIGIYVLTRGPKQVAAPTSPPPQALAPGPREPMPTGDTPGWRQVFAYDFEGHTLDATKWLVYSGQPGGDPAAWFDPRHVSVSNGMLTISGYRDRSDGGRWATGGISTRPGLVQTYGKYLVRFRLDPGTGIGHALLLVPADGSWPPEIDFSEDNGSGRVSTLATLHYGLHNSKLFKGTAVNLTQWHTLGVEWTPRLLQFTLDGRVWFRITGSSVPAVPMALAIQSQTWPCVRTWGRCPDSTTPPVVKMYVDWVVAYAPKPR